MSLEKYQSKRNFAVIQKHQASRLHSFEGVIPEGEYGGGTVMVWDRGTWIPDGLGAGAD